jgi:hypothetical protein
MSTPQDFRAVHDALAKRYADEGRLVEAGFATMCVAILPPDLTQDQVSDMRLAYMAGAQHLFASIMACLDPGSEPTLDDMRRMTLIDKELRAFHAEMKLRLAKVGGSA